MINYVWLFMMASGVATAAACGRLEAVTNAAIAASRGAVELAIGLVGVMALWMGIMRIAEKAGLTAAVAVLFRPLMHVVFPSIPKGHPAAGAIVGNLSANLLGLGNAATPLGLQAMRELQALNPDPDTATDAMCTFLALNTACLTLIPATVIALRAAAGAHTPTDIIGTTIVTTSVTTTCALVLDAFFRTSARRAAGARGSRGRQAGRANALRNPRRLHRRWSLAPVFIVLRAPWGRR